MLREFLAREEVTELCELRGRFGVMAYHGGNLERTTDAVAEEVARGGVGVVYRAVDLRVDRPVALKVLLAQDPTRLARFAALVPICGGGDLEIAVDDLFELID